ncbi:MAG TPA: superoxide dismutase [Ni] [bacterium]|nr:superoxide dismutase [Ni] [bacterium]HPO10560.1 superoxide dismutase [Ni] [bacterium]HQO34035.1 superoxide dismutase [Ni] [bacterium]HQQ00672.1 superoxide dismutase [Ni] [bacterium]
MTRQSKSLLVVVAVLLLSTVGAVKIFSHCQIPCGIYDDEMRFTMIAEHIATIEKSMQQITALSNDAAANTNQIVRWVNNKEQHADELTDIVTYYFLTQRVKPAEESDAQAYKDYTKQLTLLHKMMVHAMKAKQTVDLSNVEQLRTLLHEYHDVYFGPEKK